MSSLRETFIEELKDTFDAEQQIIKALPKMIKAAKNEEFRSSLEQHLEETRGHVTRLEQVFAIFEETPKRKKCKGMEGLLTEGAEMIKEDEGDAALISAAQKVEHYEISAYGSLAAWARLLEEDDAVELLEETLAEEKQADEKLTGVAESAVNVEEDQEEGEKAQTSSRRKVSQK